MDTISLQNSDEKALVKEFTAGNEAAFERLFKKYYQLLVKVGRFYVNDTETAEELVQDLFITIWEKREKVNPDTNFKSYLLTSVKNRCLNSIRAQKKMTYIEGEEWNDAFSSDSKTESAVQFKETRKAIEDAINELPEQCRIIFQLSRIEGLSYKEIAETLDLAPKTVENQIGRALKVLRIKLQDYFVFLLVLMN